MKESTVVYSTVVYLVVHTVLQNRKVRNGRLLWADRGERERGERRRSVMIHFGTRNWISVAVVVGTVTGVRTGVGKDCTAAQDDWCRTLSKSKCTIPCVAQQKVKRIHVLRGECLVPWHSHSVDFSDHTRVHHVLATFATLLRRTDL